MTAIKAIAMIFIAIIMKVTMFIEISFLFLNRPQKSIESTCVQSALQSNSLHCRIVTPYKDFTEQY
jgi:hypothetical protein